MRDISSAFWLGLQQDTVRICELITITAVVRTERYTTSNVPIPSSGFIYEPFPGTIPKGPTETTGKGINNVPFTISNSAGMWDDLLTAYDIDMADVKVVRVFTDSPDLDQMHVFQGKMGEYTHDRNHITGQVRDRSGAQGIQFPYYTYSDFCQWRFGSPGCGFDLSSITIAGSLDQSTDRMTITAASGFLVGSYAPNFLRFGKATFSSGQNSGHVRSVRTQTGDILGLSHPLPFNVDSGDLFEIYPGCKHRLVEDCTSTWDNSSNWLGFIWIPEQGQAF